MHRKMFSPEWKKKLKEKVKKLLIMRQSKARCKQHKVQRQRELSGLWVFGASTIHPVIRTLQFSTLAPKWASRKPAF